MPAPPDVLKYFHEEPGLRESVTPDADPDARRREDRSDLPEGTSIPLDDLLDTRDAYRGYLAGTNHANDRVGLPTLGSPDGYVTRPVEALGRSWWGRCTNQHAIEALDRDAVRRGLGAPANTTLLVSADGPVRAQPGDYFFPPVRAQPGDYFFLSVRAERMTAAAGRERRRTVAALRALSTRPTSHCSRNRPTTAMTGVSSRPPRRATDSSRPSASPDRGHPPVRPPVSESPF